MRELQIEKHAQYIRSVEKKEDFDSMVMEHMRMSGTYWGLTTLDLMDKLEDVDREAIVSWVLQCKHDCDGTHLPYLVLQWPMLQGIRQQNTSFSSSGRLYSLGWRMLQRTGWGGFGGNVGHDPHILYTLNAVQILALLDKLDVVDADKISTYIVGLQQEDGSFAGDEWGEIDTRFSYGAVCCLSILHRLDKIDIGKAINYVASCKNFDGGFGCTPGGESHAGQIFCCVGALAILGALNHVDSDLLGWWLCERQVKSGGLNGRPEKLADVCYSWWVLSSLTMIHRVHWIDKEKLNKFILACQDRENGGISDRPDDAVDVFHTFFGVAGLSLLEYPGLKAIDPAYALPVHVVDKIFFSQPQ